MERKVRGPFRGPVPVRPSGQTLCQSPVLVDVVRHIDIGWITAERDETVGCEMLLLVILHEPAALLERDVKARVRPRTLCAQRRFVAAERPEQVAEPLQHFDWDYSAQRLGQVALAGQPRLTTARRELDSRLLGEADELDL